MIQQALGLLNELRQALVTAEATAERTAARILTPVRTL